MMLGSIGIGIGIGIAIAVALVGLGLLLLEYQYRRRPGNRLEMVLGEWWVKPAEPEAGDRRRIVGEVLFVNRTRSLEIMVPEVAVQVTLLSKGSLEGVSWTARVVPNHPDEPSREDGYWFAYIVKVGKTTSAKVSIDIEGTGLDLLQSAWVRIRYVAYGPEGRTPRVEHVVVPLRFPTVDAATMADRWRSLDGIKILPVPTHLLSTLDSPVTVVQRYVLPIAQPGDIVTIGETPLAIMQGRWRHPSDVRPGWVARRLCYYFLPTSSLATACGLQTLVDIVGPLRVFVAFVIGAIAKGIFRKPGMFYQLAGEQARLIDDVTGTLPPYDQFIVLGPADPQAVVRDIQRETGLSAAIVDVNDLKAVKIVAATPDLSIELLEAALRSNPAGNAAEQTPLVLIRPT